MSDPTNAPVLQIDAASLTVEGRHLWSDLTVDVSSGEFMTVLGANGSGKTSLLKTIMGLTDLTGGTIRVAASRGHQIGYVPQQRLFPPHTPMRARDVVALGIDGHRFGIRLGHTHIRRKLEDAIRLVGASELAHRPVGQLSGGEQQRIRIAQALASDPAIMLADEPLNSLDPHQQSVVASLIDQRRRDHGTPIIFVTHDINPVLDLTDRVLYLAGGNFRLGTPEEVLRTSVLSELYGAPVDVIHSGGRVAVLGEPHHIDPHHGPTPDEAL